MPGPQRQGFVGRDAPFDLASQPGDMGVDRGDTAFQLGLEEGHGGSTQPVLQRRPFGCRSVAGTHEFGQGFELFRHRNTHLRSEAAAHVSEHLGIDPVGLGQAPAGLGEQAGAQGIDDGDGKARLAQGAQNRAMILAGRLHHDQRWIKARAFPLEVSQPLTVVRHPEPLRARVEIYVEMVFTDITADVDFISASFGQNLTLHAGLAPIHLFRTSARTAGSGSLTALSQGGDDPDHPIPGGRPTSGDQFKSSQIRTILNMQGVPPHPPPPCGRGWSGRSFINEFL